MITRIEIDGFKSFKDFSVDLAPLTVIAGANAAGKSNLFDALKVIAALASGKGLKSSLPGRGNTEEMFTIHHNGSRSSAMRFALEFNTTTLKGKSVRPFNQPNIRYEITITREPVVNDEHSQWFPVREEKIYDPAYTGHGEQRKSIGKNTPFLHVKNGKSVLNGLNDVEGLSEDLTRTVLSQTGYLNDIHILAVKEELAFLHSFVFNGENTPYTDIGHNEIIGNLARLKNTNPMAIASLRRMVQDIVPEVSEIDIYIDAFNKRAIGITDESGRKFSFDSLSYGTKKMIELVGWIANEKTAFTLLLEGIENGIDPRRQDHLFELLRRVADQDSTQTGGNRQIICTTHSPVFVSIAKEALADAKNIQVLLAIKVDHVFGDNGSRTNTRATRMYPLLPFDGEDEKARSYTSHTIEDYINQANPKAPTL